MVIFHPVCFMQLFCMLYNISAEIRKIDKLRTESHFVLDKFAESRYNGYSK